MKNRMLGCYVLIVSLMFCAVDGAYGVTDAPHDMTGGMSMGCSACHYPSGSLPPAWLLQPVVGDNAAMNNLCTGCHHEGNSSLSKAKSRNIKTHSNVSGKYGDWTVGCSVCHHAHYQAQWRAYPTEAAINTGVLTAITTTLFTVNNVLQTGSYADYIVAPNTSYPGFFYRIKDNTSDTIMSAGKIRTTYAGPGTAYAIQYGKLINNQIATAFGTVPVKFFNYEGSHSFADSDSVVDGICQVCHSKTTSFNKNGVLEGPGHPTGTAAKNCMQCHPHSNGFQAVVQ